MESDLLRKKKGLDVSRKRGNRVYHSWLDTVVAGAAEKRGKTRAGSRVSREGEKKIVIHISSGESREDREEPI